MGKDKKKKKGEKMGALASDAQQLRMLRFGS